jgi:hypothetical protein
MAVPNQQDLFEDIATAMDLWVRTAALALSDKSADLQWTETDAPYRVLQDAIGRADVDPGAINAVFQEVLRGFAVSFFTCLDGGTALAEKGRIYVTDEAGRRLGEGLHSAFVGHLMDTNRL